MVKAMISALFVALLVIILIWTNPKIDKIESSYGKQILLWYTSFSGERKWIKIHDSDWYGWF